MFFRTATIVLTLAFASQAFAETEFDPEHLPAVTYPKLAAHAAAPEGFVPAGWKIERKVPGDLNGDKRPDLVLVLRQTSAKNILHNASFGPAAFDTNPRVLAAAVASASGGFDLVLANHTLLPRPDNPSAEDYLDPNGVQGGDVEIKRGLLRITLGSFMSAGGWDMGHRTYTFRLRANRFEAIGIDSVNVDRGSGAMMELSVNTLTGRAKTTTSSISDDGPGKSSWKTWPGHTPPTLEQIGDGLAYDPLKH